MGGGQVIHPTSQGYPVSKESNEELFVKTNLKSETLCYQPLCRETGTHISDTHISKCRAEAENVAVWEESTFHGRFIFWLVWE